MYSRNRWIAMGLLFVGGVGLLYIFARPKPLRSIEKVVATRLKPCKRFPSNYGSKWIYSCWVKLPDGKRCWVHKLRKKPGKKIDLWRGITPRGHLVCLARKDDH